MTVTILDTNIFIRLLTETSGTQHQTAKSLFTNIEQGKITGVVSLLVINEVIWVMEHFYELPRREYLQSFMDLLSLKTIKFIEVKKPLLFTALKAISLQPSLDFTDAYLLQIAGSTPISSFDKHLLPKPTKTN